MHIYFKYNHAKFHPNPIWNDGALGFLKSVLKQEEPDEEEPDEYDKGTVPDP